MSNSLWPCGVQQARPPCLSPAPGASSNSCPLSRWCHWTISSPVIPFSFHRQSCPASGSFAVSQLFASGGQSIGVLASASVLPMNIHWPIPFMAYTVSISYVPFTVLSTLCIFIHGIHTTPLRNGYFYPFFQIAETKTQKVGEVAQGQMSIKSELKPKPGSNPRYLSLDSLLLLSSCQVVSDSLWPRGLQPIWLRCPWDFPGKNTGVGCHFLLQGSPPNSLTSPALAGGFFITEPPRMCRPPPLEVSFYNIICFIWHICVYMYFSLFL